MGVILYSIQTLVICLLLSYFRISCKANSFDNQVDAQIFQYILAILFLAIPHLCREMPDKNYNIPMKKFFLGWGMIALGIFIFITNVASQVWIAYGTPFEETLFNAIQLSMLIVLWGIYPLSSGPLRSSAPKRYLKVACYFFSIFMYLGYEASPLISLSIMFILMIIEIRLNVKSSKDTSTIGFEKYDEVEERVEVNL